MTADVLKSLTSSVKYSCSSTATEDVSSALAVWDVYCSAAAGKFTAAGVTASVEQTYPKGVSGVPKATGVSNGSGNGSSASGSSGSSSSSSGGNSDPNDTGKSSTNVPVIAGAIGGVIVAIILIGAAIFFVRRSANKRRDMEKLPNASGGPGLGGTEIQNNATPAGFYSPNGGKAELATDTVLAPPPPASPSPSTLKVNSPERTDNVSPVSAHHTGGSAFAPPHNNQASLYPPMPQNSSELPSPATTGYPSPPPGQPNAPELYGQGVMHAHSPQRPELAGQGTQFNNPSLNRPELQGQGAMYAPAPDRPELAGQGSHFHNANLNRPELQGQNMMFAPPPPNGTQELQGQGPGPASPYQQHQQQPYQQQQAGYQQQQAGYPQPPRSPYQQQQPYQPPQSPYQQQHPIQPPQSPYQAYQPGMGQQQQRPIEMQQMSWQSGPTPGLYEMDGARSTGQGDAGAPGVAR